MNQIKNDLIAFFNAAIAHYPATDAKIVGWSNKENQDKRFEVITQALDFNDLSVLDVGCGVGDLVGYLNNNKINSHYYGIDLHKEMVRMAKEKFATANFDCLELSEVEGKYDVVVASGPFNLLVSNNIAYVQDVIAKMYQVANKAVAFNLLSSFAPFGLRFSDFYYYSPTEIFNYCMKKYKNVVIRHDYLPHDFQFNCLSIICWRGIRNRGQKFFNSFESCLIDLFSYYSFHILQIV